MRPDARISPPSKDIQGQPERPSANVLKNSKLTRPAAAALGGLPAPGAPPGGGGGGGGPPPPNPGIGGGGGGGGGGGADIVVDCSGYY